ncbi:stage II sporulation protein D [Paenibacillus sp. N1-5-1-14]|uniref:stage II sporulation protein D n=1 Tax=Paenibacillus radicibacter TaxID=2972488 RepID=UPI002159A24F|nr:stage II sporulation protein D [Paenibacillus radicibacter]MCR8645074.1 stage II sporulation protein D [Paenibacillus radicibacter]
MSNTNTNEPRQAPRRPIIHFQTKDRPYQAQTVLDPPNKQSPFRRKSSSNRWFKNKAQHRLNKGLWTLLILVGFFFIIIVIPGFLAHREASSLSLRQLTTQNPPAVDNMNPSQGQAQVASPNPATDQVSPGASIPAAVEAQSVMIPVYLTKQKEIETIPLEDYVRGVIAAEMPLDYELEALKAQALAARTYIVRRLTEKDYSQVPVADALVTDTTTHQVYYNKSQLEALQGDRANAASKARMDKLNEAVQATRGQILTYSGKPINATFFSTSGGYTENSEDVWPFATPYLKSVSSPWDSTSPRYKETLTIPLNEVARKLGVKSISSIASSRNGIRILEKTTGHRIKTISIGGKIFTGAEVREKLGLKSAQFDWQFKDSSVILTTYGYGHGVGMSQWGANEMAKRGQSADEIVHYYYQGIAISKASNILN